MSRRTHITVYASRITANIPPAVPSTSPSLAPVMIVATADLLTLQKCFHYHTEMIAQLQTQLAAACQTVTNLQAEIAILQTKLEEQKTNHTKSAVKAQLREKELEKQLTVEKKKNEVLATRNFELATKLAEAEARSLQLTKPAHAERIQSESPSTPSRGRLPFFMSITPDLRTSITPDSRTSLSPASNDDEEIDPVSPHSDNSVIENFCIHGLLNS